MLRRYFASQKERQENQQKLAKLQHDILEKIPGAGVSADQCYREADLAIDFCEDVPRLTSAAVERIVTLFEEAGAQAKISSIHVNGWFGNYDKLTMTKQFFKEVYSRPLDQEKERILFIGDSPNDCPMFAYFPHAVGVRNILAFKQQLDCEPAWYTEKKGGLGFAEMVDILLSA
jgi:hypothetical protein